MSNLIEEKENWKLYTCRSLYEAKEILAKNGIIYNQIYEMLPLKESIHIYFNRHSNINVAYFTPLIESLAIIERPDGTPEVRKHILERS